MIFQRRKFIVTNVNTMAIRVFNFAEEVSSCLGLCVRSVVEEADYHERLSNEPGIVSLDRLLECRNGTGYKISDSVNRRLPVLEALEKQSAAERKK